MIPETKEEFEIREALFKARLKAAVQEQENKKTLRDEIAIAAMQGMLADGNTLWDNQSLQGNPEAIAQFSYEMADAMLKQRVKTKEQDK